MQPGQHIISLSLGTPAEPSAVAMVDPRTEFENKDRVNHFDVRHLKRFPADYPISTIAARVEKMMSDKRLAKNCHLLLDITLTGPAPERVFENRGLDLESFDLAKTETAERDVIGAAQVAQQTNRLHVAKDLELASTLASDILSYDPKPAARGLDLRGGRNNDLVLAVSVAIWWGDDLTWGDPDPDKAPPPVRHSGPGAWMT